MKRGVSLFQVMGVRGVNQRIVKKNVNGSGRFQGVGADFFSPHADEFPFFLQNLFRPQEGFADRRWTQVEFLGQVAFPERSLGARCPLILLCSYLDAQHRI